MDVGNACAAKVSGEQNRAEHRSLPNGVERSANEKNYADRENGALGKSQLNESLPNRGDTRHFRDAIEGQEQDDQGASDTAGPKCRPWTQKRLEFRSA